METLLGLLVGIGLSAACGFRVFVPFLGMSVAGLSGHLTLSSGFDWIATWPAFIAFATATVAEIGAYYVPWLDNLLDTAAVPASVVAGTVVTATQVTEVSPFLQWSMAAIAGGGVALTVQCGTTVARAACTGTTAGFGNFVVATVEWAAACLFTVLALVVPVVCFLAVLAVGFILVRCLTRWCRATPPVACGQSEPAPGIGAQQ